MTRWTLIAASALAAGAVMTSAAGAAPLPGMDKSVDAQSLVEKAQSWRYDRRCAWVGDRWSYRDRGRMIVCRPPSPGPGWIWYSEGPRHGWYHPRRKVWNYNRW